MTTIFCSNESVSLERRVEILPELKDLKHIWNANENAKCVDFTKNYKRVCLQFPDELLNFSTIITEDIKAECPNTDLFVLGDTSYGSCCVDEVAAAHINTDAIIHFGHACLSKVTRFPVLHIFFKHNLIVENFVKNLEEQIMDKDEVIYIFYDVGYTHKIEYLAELTKTYTKLFIGKLSLDKDPDILCWTIENTDFSSCTCVFIGKDNKSFFNISMSMKAKKWLLYDPNIDNMVQMNLLETRWMKRRYYYVEKCKDASTIGIVVGTLSSKGYLDIVKHIQNLAKKRGIRSYLLSVGKVNSAKLANFTDIDCFVLVGCPENDAYNSKEFYKPLVSVFEIEMALNPAWHLKFPETYCTDFKEILPNGKMYRNMDECEIVENDVSLISGKVRSFYKNDENCTSFSTELQEKNKNELATTTSSDSFQNRSWKGLDPALGQTQLSTISKGRSGFSLNYSDDLIN